MDHSQNASKRDRYQQMRAQVPRAPGPSTRVYVRRSGGARRVMRGEDQLVQQLVRRGFTVITNGDDSVARFVEACSRAEQIVCVDGSHVAPALLMAPASCEFVNICPPQRVTLTLCDVARSAGLRTAVYMGEDAGEDFTVDAEDLLRFVDSAT